jgi:hypothetical protein
MAAPSVRRHREPAQHLQALHPLLAQPLVVEHLGGTPEVSVGKECLHTGPVPDGVQRQPAGLRGLIFLVTALVTVPGW